MPLSRLLSFLRIRDEERKNRSFCVNALKQASFISTLSELAKKFQEEGVNALKQASFISTLAFWNPLFKRLLGS